MRKLLVTCWMLFLVAAAAAAWLHRERITQEIQKYAATHGSEVHSQTPNQTPPVSVIAGETPTPIPVAPAVARLPPERQVLDLTLRELQLELQLREAKVPEDAERLRRELAATRADRQAIYQLPFNGEGP